MAPLREHLTTLRGAAVRFLRVYAQVLFSRSPLVGLCVLAATATSLRSLWCGAVAVVLAQLCAAALELEPEARHEGAYGYNALFLGLTAASLFPLSIPAMIALIGLGALCAVLSTAALRGFLLGPAQLPVLTVPFLIACYLLLGGAVALELPFLPHEDDLSARFLPYPAALLLRSLGGVLCLPHLHSGALFFLALLIHSRIAALCVTAAGLAVYGLFGLLLPLSDPTLLPTLIFNGAYTALGLGAVWFVPSRWALLLGVCGAALSAFVGVGLWPPLSRLGMPLLILPFNAVALLMLLALRLRARDLRPKAVDFASGTPEENLVYFRTRRLRFHVRYPVQVRLPFRGVWQCTQAVDGAHTHKGQWRHGFDFEVPGADGKLFHGDGTQAAHFHCYRLPVVAVAAGTVAKVVHTVPDNEIGQLNLKENWGNLVLVYHAPGLYSMVAHLAPGTIKVYEGQIVQKGDVLGLCGNSGRSDKPHLHFQLQGSVELGAPTLPCDFNDVVALQPAPAEGQRVGRALCPKEGALLRNLEPDEDRPAYFTFPYGEVWTFTGPRGAEPVQCEVDLLGRYALRSLKSGAALYYDRGLDFFTTYDVVGDRDSVLHVLRAALPRVPLESTEALCWTDYLPLNARRFWWWARAGVEVEYRAVRDGAVLVVTGESRRKDRRGEPLVRTRAVLARGGGPLRAELRFSGRVLQIEKTTLSQPAEESR